MFLNLGRALFPREVDLVTGSPPCQPFSAAGNRGSVMNRPGSLFMDFIRIVKEVQPRFFLMENVRGLLSASLRHRSINQRGKDYPALGLDESYPKILYQLGEEFYNCHIHHKLY